MEPFLVVSLALFGGGIVTGGAFMFGVYRWFHGSQLRNLTNEMNKEIARLRDTRQQLSAQLLRSAQSKELVKPHVSETYEAYGWRDITEMSDDDLEFEREKISAEMQTILKK